MCDAFRKSGKSTLAGEMMEAWIEVFEHQALMEAEIQAGRAYDEAAASSDGFVTRYANAYNDAQAALNAYREERGLDG